MPDARLEDMPYAVKCVNCAGSEVGQVPPYVGLDTLLTGFDVVEIAWLDGSPIRFDPSLFDVVVKARPGPIRQGCDVPVFDRIEVGVFDMTPKVVLIADSVFPIPSLPHADLAFSSAGCVRFTGYATMRVELTGEDALDLPPPSWIVGVAHGK